MPENIWRPRTDSNESLALLRNKVRLQLVPLLKEYNPGIAEALLRTAKIAEDEIDFIERLGDIAWERIIKIKNNAVLITKWVLPESIRHYKGICCERLSSNWSVI